MADTPPKGFARFHRQAEKVAQDENGLRALIRNAQHKLDRYRSELSGLRTDLPVLLRLTRAWSSGDYRKVPWKALVLVVGAILYFFSPLDAVPDFIPVIGFVDDAAVVGYVVRALRDELQAFAAWEAELEGGPAALPAHSGYGAG